MSEEIISSESKQCKALVKALAEDLNSKYKTISEMRREMNYPDASYLSRKVKKLGIGIKIKEQIFLSPEEQEILRNSINRRDKEEKEN